MSDKRARFGQPRNMWSAITANQPCDDPQEALLRQQRSVYYDLQHYKKQQTWFAGLSPSDKEAIKRTKLTIISCVQSDAPHAAENTRGLKVSACCLGVWEIAYEPIRWVLSLEGQRLLRDVQTQYSVKNAPYDQPATHINSSPIVQTRTRLQPTVRAQERRTIPSTQQAPPTTRKKQKKENPKPRVKINNRFAMLELD